MQLPRIEWHVATITNPSFLDRILNVLCRSAVSAIGVIGEILGRGWMASPGELRPYRRIFVGTRQTLKAKGCMWSRLNTFVNY